MAVVMRKHAGAHPSIPEPSALEWTAVHYSSVTPKREANSATATVTSRCKPPKPVKPGSEK